MLCNSLLYSNYWMHRRYIIRQALCQMLNFCNTLLVRILFCHESDGFFIESTDYLCILCLAKHYAPKNTA